jgi:hypothetical protein
MGIVQKTTSIWQAFKAGRELENAAVWKDGARLTGAITAFLAAIFGIAAAWGYHWDISQDDLVAIASGIVGVLSVYHTIVHTVTSAKVGFGAVGVQPQHSTGPADSAAISDRPVAGSRGDQPVAPTKRRHLNPDEL